MEYRADIVNQYRDRRRRKTRMKKKGRCEINKNDLIMIRLLQIIAAVCIADMAYTLWRCMG